MTLNAASSNTRQQLLDAAFAEIHRHGFRAASLDAILGSTALTKGALYHHFRNKQGLGYAVVEERIAPWIEAQWRPAVAADNPIDAAIEVIHSSLSEADDETLALGCPLCNLMQEMSPLDEGFRTRLLAIVEHWRNGLAAALLAGQQRGLLRSNADTHACATFIINGVQGCICMAKCTRDPALLHQGMAGLIQFLESLRSATEPS